MDECDLACTFLSGWFPMMKNARRSTFRHIDSKFLRPFFTDMRRAQLQSEAEMAFVHRDGVVNAFPGSFGAGVGMASLPRHWVDSVAEESEDDRSVFSNSSGGERLSKAPKALRKGAASRHQ